MYIIYSFLRSEQIAPRYHGRLDMVKELLAAGASKADSCTVTMSRRRTRCWARCKTRSNMISLWLSSCCFQNCGNPVEIPDFNCKTISVTFVRHVFGCYFGTISCHRIQGDDLEFVFVDGFVKSIWLVSLPGDIGLDFLGLGVLWCLKLVPIIFGWFGAFAQPPENDCGQGCLFGFLKGRVSETILRLRNDYWSSYLALQIWYRKWSKLLSGGPTPLKVRCMMMA